MLISEYIQQLQERLDAHGDMPIVKRDTPDEGWDYGDWTRSKGYVSHYELDDLDELDVVVIKGGKLDGRYALSVDG